MFDYDENRFDGHGHLLGESRYRNSTLFRVVARRAGMHKCRGHMDVQERPLPCTTTSAPFTLFN
ncbi:MAG: hypothetical protein P8163_01710 [Candidatus Thiodiazotropha sp.]